MRLSPYIYAPRCCKRSCAFTLDYFTWLGQPQRRTIHVGSQLSPRLEAVRPLTASQCTNLHNTMALLPGYINFVPETFLAQER